MYRWVRERHMIGIRGRNFMEAPWAGGIVLLGCVIIAMLLANLPATSLYYRHLLETDLSLMVHSPDGLIDWVFPRGMTVEKLINDGLMVIFFFAVGLEIKREIVCGQLSSAKKALLPVLAAAGGMLFPAIIFTAFNHGTMAANGWGIPTATDIAFAIGILSMLGDRVPVSLKIFLTALAIADDLGAILVIALFYGGQVQIGCLLAALVIMLGVYFMKEMGEKRMFFYLVPAVVVWGLFYYSGVHSTISGVAMAMLIPMTPRYSKEYFVHKMRHLKALMLAAGTSGDDFPNENHRFYGGDGRLLRTARGKTAGHISCELGRREVGAGRTARRGDVAHALRRGVSGRYRIHDVAVRRCAGLHRTRPDRPGQNRDPDGLDGRRRRGQPADTDFFEKTNLICVRH